MCATSTMSLHPTPTTHPNPTCYVASNMCATSTMSLHPTPPTHPNPTCYVASNMCATSTMSLHPTPPIHPNPRDRREGKCTDPTVYSGRSTFRNASLRPTGANNKPSKGIAQTPTNQTQQKYNPDVPQWPFVKFERHCGSVKLAIKLSCHTAFTVKNFVHVHWKIFPNSYKFSCFMVLIAI